MPRITIWCHTLYSVNLIRALSRIQILMINPKFDLCKLNFDFNEKFCLSCLRLCIFDQIIVTMNARSVVC